MSKKQDFAGLPTSAEVVGLNKPSRSKRAKAFVIGLCLGVLGTGGFVLQTGTPTFAVSKPSATALCPQSKPIVPIKHSAIWEGLVKESTTDEYKTRAIEWLSGAVRVQYVSSVLDVESNSNYAFRTESHDNMGPVGVDPRWEVFGPFHDYLLKTFPLAYVITTRPDQVFDRFAVTRRCL